MKHGNSSTIAGDHPQQLVLLCASHLQLSCDQPMLTPELAVKPPQSLPLAADGNVQLALQLKYCQHITAIPVGTMVPVPKPCTNACVACNCPCMSLLADHAPPAVVERHGDKLTVLETAAVVISKGDA